MKHHVSPTDRVIMAERIQVGISLSLPLFDVRRIFDTRCHSSDYQRIEEIT